MRRASAGPDTSAIDNSLIRRSIGWSFQTREHRVPSVTALENDVFLMPQDTRAGLPEVAVVGDERDRQGPTANDLRVVAVEFWVWFFSTADR